MPHQQQIPLAQNNQDATAALNGFFATPGGTASAATANTDQLMQPFPPIPPYNGEMTPHAAAAAAAFGMIPNHPMYHPNAIAEWQAQAAAMAAAQQQQQAAQSNKANDEMNDGPTGEELEEKEDQNGIHINKKEDRQQLDEPSPSSKSKETSSLSSSKKSPIRKGSNESDEEAAATALLMAGGGTRSENVESMQAAVRNKKHMLMMKVKGEEKQQQMQQKREERKRDERHLQQHQREKSSSKDRERESRKMKERERRNGMERRSESSSRDKSNNSGYTSSGSGNLSSSLVLNNFPIVLHEVLSKSEYAGTALEWMSHGKSWRVLRWDELSENVIPAYFPEMCVRISSSRDKKKATATERMNMFIRQIKIWGFKEVREVGPDLGSFHHEFFMKIAPNLTRHMKLVRKGSSSSSKRPADSTNIVSPPRKSQRVQHMMPMPPAHQFHPGFVNTPEVFKKKSRTSGGGGESKRHMYTENREDFTADTTSPDRTGPRCVSFQERGDGDDSSGQSNRHQSYESPRSHSEIHQMNFVSPSSQIHESQKHGGHVGVRSNRGGSRSSRVVEREDSGGSGSSRNGFSVSSRGRGHRNISSRGRSSKSPSSKLEKDREGRSIHDDEPLIIKTLEKAESKSNAPQAEKLS